MQLHAGKATVAAVALAEIGALAGTVLCWAFFAGWARSSSGPLPMQPLLGVLMWAAMIGAPLGAVALPVLGLGPLRRIPLGRALGCCLGGATLGLLAAVLLVHGPAILPVPAVVPLLGFGGLFVGAAVARVERLWDRGRSAHAVV